MIIIVKTVYIDVLVCVNLFINYFILLAVCKFSKLQPKQWRIVCGALFGALSSLIILLPHINVVVNISSKLIIAAVIIIITFGIKSKKILLKNICSFFLISFSFCGLMLTIWYFLTPQGMFVNNSVVYFNISPVILIVSTLVCYAIVRIVTAISGRSVPKLEICKVKVFGNGTYTEFFGKVDTGNTLTEPFSGAPVIVTDIKTVENVAPKNIIDYMTAKATNEKTSNTYNCNIRLIPFNSIGGDGLLAGFEPDDIYINGTPFDSRLFIAICDSKRISGSCKAIVNPMITDQV